MDSSSPLSSAPSDPDSLPSSPLSALSRTPSLPSSPSLPLDAAHRYPSPMSTAPSTTPSGTQSPIKLGDPIDDDDPELPDGGPPAKKRRIAAPRERTTRYLDLTKPYEDFSAEDTFQMERLLTALRRKKKVVVVAGAGISVSAGIPDFRSSTGLFATARSQHKLKASGKHLFDASVYRHDASTQSFHAMVREMAQVTQIARPTPFHHLLASLAQEGRLLRLYSQNIDCIDTSMQPLATNVPLNPRGPWPTTVQLHGGLDRMVCTKCGQLQPFRAEVFDGPEAPLCEACMEQDQVRTEYGGKRSHGIGRVRPRFVLYNEYNPDEEAIGNVSSADLRARPDAVIVVGTTLKVPGTRRLVKEMCQVTRGRRDGFTAWINTDSEPKGAEFKDCWDLVVRSKCDEVASLVALPPWDCNIGDDYLVSQEQDLESQDRRSKTTFAVDIHSGPNTKLEVQLGAMPKQVGDLQGIPTPRASPTITLANKSGKTKTKQTKISFLGTKATANGDKPAKAAKPRSRKPKKQPADPKAPKSTVLQSFKAVKNTSDRVMAGKPGHDDAQSGIPPAKEEGSNSPPGLPSLRPERRGSEDSFLYKREMRDSKSGEGSSERPSTPTAPERRIPRDTISPKSVPNNMHNLIDMV